MARIVLIDDDKQITEPLVRTLRQQGYETLVANDGRTGLELVLAQPPDLIILDIMLPELDGWAVCRQVRQRSTVPILMLTALGEELDRVLGLELGADDYLTKPFSTRELLARIRAMLRRIEFDRTVPAPALLRSGDVELNLDARQVFKGGRELALRHKEFELLSLLMARAGQTVTRAEIFDKVWGTDWLGDTRTLDVHIRWLREKIEDDAAQPRYIQTVRSVGYRFAPLEER